MTNEERITTLIDALSRNPRLAHINWHGVIPRHLAKTPARKRAIILDCWEKWCRRQAQLLLEESPPATGAVQ